jgi:hypothetical protein
MAIGMESTDLKDASWFLERGDFERALKQLELARKNALEAHDLDLMHLVVSKAETLQARMTGTLQKDADWLVDLARENVKLLTRVAGERSPALAVGWVTTDEEGTFTARGRNGQLMVTPQKIIISRKGAMGFMTQGHKGLKEISLEQISAVQFKKNGPLTAGYIQFSFMGGSETKHGIRDAVTDENSIMFKKSQEPDFIRAKELIDQYRQALRQPHAPPRPSSVADELEKLVALRDKGVLNEEEFTAQKSRLLGS